MQNKLISLTDRQYRLLPILAAHYDLQSSTAAIRAAVDAMIATCAEMDSRFADAVKLSDSMPEPAGTTLPERIQVPELVSA
jgi:hypothetical protein